MRLAVLSDIHGNLTALDAVLADLAAQGGADLIAIAGDLCLDGPRPRETLARVRALGCPVVQGNTDRDLAGPDNGAEGDHAALFRWTRAQLGEDELAYLRDLPFSHRVPAPDGSGALLIVHANPLNLDDALRPLAPEAQLAPLLAEVAPDITTLVFGHVHLPYVRQVGRLTLVDVASAGLPKDGDRRAGYGLLTWVDGAWSVEQRRVEYPVEEVVAQWRAAEAPGSEEVVKTLLRARYPNMAAARGGRAPAPARRPSAPVAAPEAVAASPAAPAKASPARARATARIRSRPARATPALAPATPETVPVPSWEPPSPPSIPEPPAPPEVSATAAGILAELDAEAIGVEEVAPSAAVGAGPAAGEDDTPSLVAELGAAPADDEPDDAPLASDDDSGDDEPGDDEAEDDEAEDDEPDEATPPKAKKRRRSRGIGIADLAPDASLPDLLPGILAGRLDAILAQAEGVAADEDPEAVHDMRVATRRLRAALDAAKPFYGGKAHRRATRRVRRLAHALGAVRDGDVLLARLRALEAAAPPDERAGLEGLIDRISADRAAARADLDPVLDRWADPDEGDAAAFRDFAAEPRTPKGKARARALAGAAAARALDARLDDFASRAVVFEEEGADAESFHDLRIAAKNLRYTIELFAPILGDQADGLLKELRSLQELLGALHDDDVLIDLLAWERAGALERQLHMLEFATLNPGPRAERLGAVRDYLNAPDSFVATAIGIYGLLIDVGDERDATEDRLRARWAELMGADFLPRLHALADDVRRAGEKGKPTATVEATPGEVEDAN